MSTSTSWWSVVLADHRALQAMRARYDDRYPDPEGDGSLSSGPVAVLKDLATNVGFQQLVVFRAAQVFHRRGLSPIAMLLSRAIRHVYGAEMHWAAAVEPGIVIVHGNGLVVSRAASVGPRCQLSQNVTLGLSSGSGDRPGGAPHLVADVHVSPGAVLLGPIEVGPNCKVGPNAVVMSDVAPDTVVLAPDPVIRPRRARG